MTDKKIELSQFYVKKEELRDHNSSEESHPDLRTASSKSSIVDMIYPVGSIYMSVNSASPATLFGGTWRKIEGQFLLASGKTPNVNKTYTAGSSGGSKDAVIVQHNHTQNAHTHIQNNHNHSQNTHSHSNKAADNGYKYLLADDNIVVNGTPRGAVGGDGDWHYVYASTKSGGFADIIEHQNTATAKATNNATQAINQNTTATNQSTGVSGTDANMPPYLVVNIWERTQ